MVKSVLVTISTLIVALACGQQGDKFDGATEHAATIIYDGVTFNPIRLDINLGDVVRFENLSSDPMWPASNIHPTHEIYSKFDPKRAVAAGDSWFFKFDRSGFWRYHNHLAPNISGLVVTNSSGTEQDVEPLPFPKADTTFSKARNLSLEGYQDLYDSEIELLKHIQRYGPAQTVEALHQATDYFNADCHQRAHVVGRKAYELFGAAAFYLSSHKCQAGSYHGATEALFRDRGTADLQDDVTTLCGYATVLFYYHQCIHGVGHGLMAWTSYELHDALNICEELQTPRDHLACYSGVFMENVVGGLSGSMGHTTTFLSDDPHYPCNILAERHVPTCYLYQSTRIASLFQWDFTTVGKECSKAPEVAHHHCFRSMGRDVAGFTGGDAHSSIERCSTVIDPTNRAYCIEGAVQDGFWDASGADKAAEMCSLIEDIHSQFACYRTIVFRALELYETKSEYLGFCELVEVGFRTWCRNKDLSSR